MGDDNSFTKIWRACLLKIFYLVDLYDVILQLLLYNVRGFFSWRCHWGWWWRRLVCDVYLLIVEVSGLHTGLPWRLCGRHKVTVYRLSVVDVTLYYVVFSSGTVSKLTIFIKAKTSSWDIICIWQCICVKTVIHFHIDFLWLTNTTSMTHLADVSINIAMRILFSFAEVVFCVYSVGWRCLMTVSEKDRTM